MHAAATIDYRSELFRKAIHLCSLSIPVVYTFITRDLALVLLIPVTAGFLVVDLARYYLPPVARLFYRVFGSLLRKHEQDEKVKRLNGATNVLLSAVLCVLVFPKLVTITAFAILIISDSTSALVGRRFGRRRFFRKSLEGALSFFVSAILVVLVSPKAGAGPAEYLLGFVAAAFGAVVESASPIDDNIAVPVGIGIVLWVLYALFLPGVDLSGPAAIW
jgi:dolichol kinase